MCTYQVDVETAADGSEAVEKCNATQYDAILMDLEMPMPGDEAAAAILSASGLNRNTPIMLWSSDDPEVVRSRGLSAGVRYFIDGKAAGRLDTEKVGRIMVQELSAT